MAAYQQQNGQAPQQITFVNTNTNTAATGCPPHVVYAPVRKKSSAGVIIAILLFLLLVAAAANSENAEEQENTESITTTESIQPD